MSLTTTCFPNYLVGANHTYLPQFSAVDPKTCSWPPQTCPTLEKVADFFGLKIPSNLPALPNAWMAEKGSWFYKWDQLKVDNLIHDIFFPGYGHSNPMSIEYEGLNLDAADVTMQMEKVYSFTQLIQLDADAQDQFYTPQTQLSVITTLIHEVLLLGSNIVDRSLKFCSNFQITPSIVKTLVKDVIYGSENVKYLDFLIGRFGVDKLFINQKPLITYLITDMLPLASCLMDIDSQKRAAQVNNIIQYILEEYGPNLNIQGKNNPLRNLLLGISIYNFYCNETQKTLELLMKHGANLDLVENSLLVYFLSSEPEFAQKNLLSNGLDINLKPEKDVPAKLHDSRSPISVKKGDTLLHAKVKDFDRFDHDLDHFKNLILYLCELGADINIKNDQGKSPLDIFKSLYQKAAPNSAQEEVLWELIEKFEPNSL